MMKNRHLAEAFGLELRASRRYTATNQVASLNVGWRSVTASTSKRLSRMTRVSTTSTSLANGLEERFWSGPLRSTSLNVRAAGLPSS